MAHGIPSGLARIPSLAAATGRRPSPTSGRRPRPNPRLSRRMSPVTRALAFLFVAAGWALVAAGCAKPPPPPLPTPFDDQVCSESSFRVALPLLDAVIEEGAAREAVRALRSEWGATGEIPEWVDLGVRWDALGTPRIHPFRSNLDDARAWEVARRLEPHLRPGIPAERGARWVEQHIDPDGTVGLRLHVRLTGIPPVQPMASARCLPHRHHGPPLHQAHIQPTREPRPGISGYSVPIFRLTLDAYGNVVSVEIAAAPDDPVYRRLAQEAIESAIWDPGVMNGEPRAGVSYWRVSIPMNVRQSGH